MNSTTNATTATTNATNTKVTKNIRKNTKVTTSTEQSNVEQKKGTKNVNNNKKSIPVQNHSNDKNIRRKQVNSEVTSGSFPTKERIQKLRLPESSVLMKFLDKLYQKYGEDFRSNFDAEEWIAMINQSRFEYEDEILDETADENSFSLSVAQNILSIQNNMIYPNLTPLLKNYSEIRSMEFSKDENKHIPVWKTGIFTGFTLRDMLIQMNISNIVDNNIDVARELAGFINFVLPHRQFDLVRLPNVFDGLDTAKIYVSYEAEIVAHLIFIFFEKIDLIPLSYRTLLPLFKVSDIVPNVILDNLTSFQKYLKSVFDKSVFDKNHSNPNNANFLVDGLFIMAVQRYSDIFITTMDNHSNDSVTTTTNA